MKQIKNTLFIFLIISLFPISVVGQDYGTYQHAINELDVRIRNLVSDRKINRENQEKINAFVAEAGKWFTASSEIQNKINQARNSQNLEQEIQKLEQEQKAINSLNGGTYVVDKTYFSINELRSELTEKSKEMVRLINEDEQIRNNIQSLDIDRDKCVAGAESENKIDSDEEKILEDRKVHLNFLGHEYIEEFSKVYSNIKTEAIWCTQKDKNSPLKCMHRNLYIAGLSELYINKLAESGKKYDENELAGMIKNAQKESKRVKDEAAPNILKKMDEQIKSMNQEINEIDKKLRDQEKIITDIDPSGCWIIGIGKGTQPVVEIKENANGEFVGTVTTSGTIHKNYQGRVLFILTRINVTTFEGTEYAYTDKGYVKARIPVRIIINKNRRGIEYRTVEQILTLRPCGM